MNQTCSVININFLLIFLLWSAAINGQNLILNPDAELPLVAGKIPAWVETRGTSWTTRATDPTPQQGQTYFFAGNEAEAELTQVVAVSDYACAIDFGGQTFQFNGFVRSDSQSPTNQSQIIIELLTDQDALLGTYDSGVYMDLSIWTPVTTRLPVPPRTRKIRIRLQSHRKNGGSSTSYFDNLSLRPSPADKSIRVDKATSISATCGNFDGSLVIQTLNGSGQIFYSLDGTTFQSSNTYTGLAAGIYTITVKDQSTSGCTAIQSATVLGGSGPLIDTVVSVSATCGQANGSLTVGATGIGQIHYSLNGSPFQDSNTFTGLSGGSYTVTVNEQSTSGCTTTQRVTLLAGSGPSIQRIVPIVATCGQTNGSLTVSATVASGSALYSLDGVTFQTNNTFPNLAGGVYTITVKDQSTTGCTAIQSTTVLEGGPRIQRVITTPASCGQANGSLVVSATGTSQLQYSLDGLPFQRKNTFENLAGGIYTVVIEDPSTPNCSISQRVPVTSTIGPTIQRITTTATSCGQTNGSATVITTGGDGPIQYSVDGITFQATNTFITLPPGNYTVTIKDQTNCTVRNDFTIAMGCLIYVPDAFTPNDDGLNDYFLVYSANSVDYFITQLAIYNRWGEAVFVKRNFSILEPSAAWWDGSVNGEKAPAGPYSYSIHYGDSASKGITQTGRILLIR